VEPPCIRFVLEKFTSTGARGITYAVRPPERPTDAKFKCKIYVDITNELAGQPVRLAAAYFLFKKNSPLDPDPQWPREPKTERFHLCFFSPPTKMHDWRDIYLRPGETTNIWIGIHPRHSDYDFERAHRAERIGRLLFQMTRWTDSGNPKARWVRVNL